MSSTFLVFVTPWASGSDLKGVLPKSGRRLWRDASHAQHDSFLGKSTVLKVSFRAKSRNLRLGNRPYSGDHVRTCHPEYSLYRCDSDDPILSVLPGLAWDFSLSAILGDILPLRPCRHPELPHPSSRACRGISVLFHPGTGADPSPSTLSAKSSHVGFIFPIRNSFFSLRQRFSCFSRAIASRGSLYCS